MTGPRTHYVYRAYDAAGACLYVGMTNDVRRRRSQHRSMSAWHAAAVRCVVRGPYDLETARTVERELIGYLLPDCNIGLKPQVRTPIRHRHLRDIAEKHPDFPPYGPTLVSPAVYALFMEANRKAEREGRPVTDIEYLPDPEAAA